MASRTYDATGAHAVTVAQDLVESLHWIFRRQPESDFGIDAHIEIVAARKPTGRLVAAQIKGGQSYFKLKNRIGYTYYIDEHHLEYWINFSLPVVVILVDIDNRTAYWQQVTPDTVTKTKKGWKLVVPFASILDVSATEPLFAIGDAPEPVRRLTELTLARVWMRYLREGKRLFVEMEEWVNKSSGRGSLRLILQDDDTGDEQHVLTWPLMFLGSLSFEQAVRDFFPWANVEMDDQLYEEADTERWIESNGMWDSEEGRYWYDPTHLSEYLENRREYAHYAEVRPYDEDGEVAKYRFELTLNSLGAGFLEVSTYLFNAPIAVRPAIPGGLPTRGAPRRR